MGIYIIQIFIIIIMCMVSTAMIVQSTPTDNPLDIGSVKSCVSIQSTMCSSIDYLVPEPIANLAKVIEEVINSTYARVSPDAQSIDCKNGLLESLCNEQYPRCNLEDKSVNAQVPVNCTQRLSTCSSVEFANGYCNFEIVNASLDQCKTVTELANKTGYVFKQCNRVPDLNNDYVTEWMFNYLVSIDQDLDEFLSLFQTSEQCTLDYIDFRCRSVGRCWDNGNRIELTRNQTDCMATRSLDCFSSTKLRILQPEKEVCEQWPEELQLPTITTPITDSPTEPDNTTTTSSSTTVSTTSTATPTSTSISLPTIFPPSSAKSINHGGYTAFVVCMLIIVLFKLL